MSHRVDARNMDCPQPVVLTKKALDGMAEGVVTVLVDNAASVANVRRFAESQGCTVHESEKTDHTELEIVKGFACRVPDTEPEPEASGIQSGSAIIYITSDQVGPDEELGRHLLKVFIRNMLEVSRDELPEKIIFVNRGVLVPCSWGESIEDLKALEDLGVDIFSCGVCLKHYDLMEQLQVGQVGNAFDTVQAFLVNRKMATIC